MKRNIIITALVAAGLSGVGHAVTVAAWDFTQASGQLTDTTSNGNNLTNGGAGGGAIFNTTTGADFGSTYNKLTYDAAGLNPATIGAGETWTLNITGQSFNVNPVGTTYHAIWGNRQGGGDGLFIYKYKDDISGNSNKFQLWYHNGSAFGQLTSILPSTSTDDNYELMVSYINDTDTLTFGVSTDGGVTFDTQTGVVGGTGLNIVGDAFNFGYIENYPTNFTFDGTIQGASIDVIPEPSSSVPLLALGGLALVLRRRK